jgi:hypothetical protein
MGRTSATRDLVLFVLERFDRRERLDFYAFEKERHRKGVRKPGVRKEKEKALGQTSVIKPTQFPIK